jgi:hypothetical protein
MEARQKALIGRVAARGAQGIAALAIAVSLYVLSYAPFLRCVYGTDEANGSVCLLYCNPIDWERFEHGSHPEYAPVEWLNDHTSLGRLLDGWAELWGVGITSKLLATSRLFADPRVSEPWEALSRQVRAKKAAQQKPTLRREQIETTNTGQPQSFASRDQPSVTARSFRWQVGS